MRNGSLVLLVDLQPSLHEQLTVVLFRVLHFPWVRLGGKSEQYLLMSRNTIEDCFKMFGFARSTLDYILNRRRTCNLDLNFSIYSIKMRVKRNQ